jgi:hypothetical protein
MFLPIASPWANLLVRCLILLFSRRTLFGLSFQSHPLIRHRHKTAKEYSRDARKPT